MTIYIVSYRNSCFTSNFCEVFKDLGAYLKLCTTFHPPTNKQTEHLNKTLEDLLYACALNFEDSCDSQLS